MDPRSPAGVDAPQLSSNLSPIAVFALLFYAPASTERRIVVVRVTNG